MGETGNETPEASDAIGFIRLDAAQSLSGSMEYPVPAPHNYGGFGIEPFPDYLARWPRGVSAMPDSLIETWAYRHWIEFSSYWIPADALNWTYELRKFSNLEILEIRTDARTMVTLDYWGDQLMTDKVRKDSWLGKFMLTNGTTPKPILVFEGGGDIEHPRGLVGAMMIEPFQLVEGHMRLAYLRGMQRAGCDKLQESHEVWVATRHVA